MAWADYITQIVPTWLAKRASRLLRTFGQQGDALAADATDQADYGRLDLCGVDGLNPHARNSGLRRATGETDAALRTYLRRRWDTWDESGGEDGMLYQLLRLGYSDAQIWSYLRLYSIAPSAFGGGRLHGFWFLVLKGMGVTGAKEWDGGQEWAATPRDLWGLQGISREQLDDIIWVIRKFKPATTSCRFIVLETDANDPVEIFTPQWSKLDAPQDRALGQVSLKGIHCHEPNWYISVGINPASEGVICSWRAAQYGPQWFTEYATPAGGCLRGCGGAQNTLWAVGDGGQIVRQRVVNNQLGIWEDLTGPVVTTLRDVWARTDSDAWAVGDGGEILHYDGTSWTQDTSPVATALHGVWGTSASNVWAVGDGGEILHYDGTSWTQDTSPVTERLRSVFGVNANNVWAVGENGVAAFFDGTSWASVATGSTSDLWGVWGQFASEVWAVGEAGTILLWDGTAWAAVTSPTTQTLYGIHGTAFRDGWAVGDPVIARLGGRIGGSAVIIPVHEPWEFDPLTNAAREFYNYSYTLERT